MVNIDRRELKARVQSISREQCGRLDQMRTISDAACTTLALSLERRNAREAAAILYVMYETMARLCLRLENCQLDSQCMEAIHAED
jgi:hypothetical protein